MSLLDHPEVQKELTQMPIFSKLIKEYKKTKPFEGLHIGISHVLASNTMVMLYSLLVGGASLDIIIENGLSHDKSIIQWLKENQDEYLRVIDTIDPNESYEYTLDCASNFLNTPPTKGSVEVTRTGIHLYEAAGATYTNVDVDSTKVKMIETFLGNPEGVYLTLDHFLGNADLFLEDAKIAIIGFGKIGRGSARRFRDLSKILIVDISEVSLSIAEDLGFDTYKLSDDPKRNSEMIADMDIIITATGIENVVTSNFEKEGLKNALKINLGAVDEWGTAYTEEEIFHSKTKPFNFNLSPPTPSKFIDPILALQVEALADLIRHPENYSGLARVSRNIENHILNLYMQIHEDDLTIIDEYFRDYDFLRP